MQVSTQNPPDNQSIIPEFWRIDAVLAHLPFSRSTMLRRVADGSFPAPVRLSANVVAWRSADVLEWLSGIGRASK